MVELRMRPTQLKTSVDPPPRILVVDDNQDAAHTLTRLLNVLGFIAEATYSGESAIAAIEDCAPAIAFLDLGMPVMDGVETATRIRQSENGREVVLIALTGHEREEDVARTRAAGFVAHLVKPVDLAALEKALCELCGYPLESKSPAPK